MTGNIEVQSNVVEGKEAELDNQEQESVNLIDKHIKNNTIPEDAQKIIDELQAKNDALMLDANVANTTEAMDSPFKRGRKRRGALRGHRNKRKKPSVCKRGHCNGY